MVYPDQNYTIEDGSLLKRAKPRIIPLPGYNTILQQNLALIEPPNTKLHVDNTHLLRTYGPTPEITTCPITHEWFVLRSKRGMFWYLLQFLDIERNQLVQRKEIRFIHWLKYRHFIRGTWCYMPTIPRKT